jgi:hypothetical protein
MSAPTVVRTALVDINFTTGTMTFADSASTGDLIIVGGQFASWATVTLSVSGFSELITNTGPNENSVAQRIWYKLADGTEGASIVFTTSGSASKRLVGYHISGHGGIGNFGTNSSGSSTVESLIATPEGISVSANSLVLFIGITHNTSTTNGSISDDFGSGITGSGQRISSYRRVYSSAGTANATFSWTTAVPAKTSLIEVLTAVSVPTHPFVSVTVSG